MIKLKNNKRQYLTIKEKREIMVGNGKMPTAIFLADKKEYIVKPRGTIFGRNPRKRKSQI